MTMKEACQYKIDTARKRNRDHMRKVLIEVGPDAVIDGFTDKEWNRMEVRQKTSFAKGKSAAYTSVWRHNNLTRITKDT